MELQKRTDYGTSLTASEVQLIEAFRSKRIVECSQVEISIMLGVLITLCGCKIPENHEKLVLVEFIQDKYKHYSLDEFRIAFHDAIAAGTIITRAEQVWSLDPVLIGRVMKQYERKRSELKKKLIRIPKVKPLPTPQENYEALIGYAKEDKIPGGFNYASAYLHAEKIGVITLSIVDKQQYADKVRVDMTREMNAQEEAFAQLTQMQMENPQMFRSECRTRLMKDHLKENYGI